MDIFFFLYCTAFPYLTFCIKLCTLCCTFCLNINLTWYVETSQVREIPCSAVFFCRNKFQTFSCYFFLPLFQVLCGISVHTTCNPHFLQMKNLTSRNGEKKSVETQRVAYSAIKLFCLYYYQDLRHTFFVGLTDDFLANMVLISLHIAVCLTMYFYT